MKGPSVGLPDPRQDSIPPLARRRQKWDYSLKSVHRLECPGVHLGQVKAFALSFRVNNILTSRPATFFVPPTSETRAA